MKRMKRIICVVFAAAVVGLCAAPMAGATIRSETVDFHGVKIVCDVSDLGVLQIRPSSEQQKQIIESLQNAAVELDLSGIKGLKGFSICLDEWHLLTLEYSNDVKLFISPQAAAAINDHSGGKQTTLEVKYSFAADNSVTDIELALTAQDRKNIDVVGVVCFPTSSDNQNTVFTKDGQIIAKSGIQKGLFYSALCLNGKYSVTEAEPLIFEDEIPSWAKNSVEWMSARGVISGSEGNFRPDAGITRAEFLTMFERLYNRGEPGVADTLEYKDLADVPGWAAVSYVAIFLDNGSSDFLYPNKVMTRGEMVNVVGGYMRIGDLFYDETEYETPFSDADTLNSAQAYDVKMLSRIGVLCGYGGAVRLEDTATRAQAAELLCRFAQWETQNRAYR